MKPAHALGVVLVLAVLLLSAVPLSGGTATFHAVPRSTGASASYAALDAPHAYLARLIASDPALTESQRSALASVIPMLPLATVLAVIGGDENGYLQSLPVDAAQHLAAVFAPFDCFINCAFDAGLTTCAVGAGFAVAINAFAGEEGGLGIPVAAGIGCVGGLLAGSLGFYFGGQQAIQDDINSQAVAWMRAQVTVLGNCVNSSGSFLGNAIQLLNFTQDYFNARAESAVYAQLANSTFNVLLDGVQSGIDAQALDVQWAAEQTQANCYAGFQSWWVANFGGGGRFNAVPGADIVLTNVLGLSDTYNPTTAPQYVGGEEITPSGVFAPVFINHGAATQVIACATTCNANTFNINAWPVGGGSAVRIWGCTSGNTTCWPNPALFAGPSGAYNVTFSGSFTAHLLIYGGSDIQTGSYTGAWTQDFVMAGNATNGFFHQGVAVHATANSQSSATITLFANASWNPAYANALLIKAEQQAQVYWAFLRALGFHSASEVPAGCIIPTPNEILPPGADVKGLTITEYQSLYYGWLQGLATFYNTTLNATNFCGTQGHKQFVLGDNGYWPLFINATVAVYIPNATLYPTEDYGNVSTWPYIHTQALLTPTLATMSIPVGQAFRIPENDPLSVFLVKPGIWLNLFGNGTNVSIPNPQCFNGCGVTTSFVPLTSSTPGAAIYLYSCIIGGTPQATCTMTVQTINQTIIQQNVTCEPTCGGGGTTIGGGFTLPNPFTALAQLFCSALKSVLGPNCVGELTTIFQVLFVIAVVLIVIWVIVWVYGRFENARGGRRGPEAKG